MRAAVVLLSLRLPSVAFAAAPFIVAAQRVAHGRERQLIAADGVQQPDV